MFAFHFSTTKYTMKWIDTVRNDQAHQQTATASFDIEPINYALQNLYILCISLRYTICLLVAINIYMYEAYMLDINNLMR